MANNDYDMFEREEEYIYEPLKGYKNVYKARHLELTKQMLNDLVLKSNVNIDENKATVNKLKNNEKLLEKSKKRLNTNKGWRTFLIILSVLAGLFFVYGIYGFATGSTTLAVILSFALGLVALVGFILVIVLYLKPIIKSEKENVDKLSKLVAKLKSEAWDQMNPLNKLFTKGMNVTLFEQTLPLFKLDKYFDSRRLDYLVGHFGFDATNYINSSTLYVQSGDINGNPFFICRDLIRTMGTKTYHGSLVITWTDTTVINGRTVVRTRTQTLHASLTKPCPYYSKQSYIVYGNEAAPRLSFTRLDSDAEKLTEKEIDKLVNKKIKEYKKYEKKSLMKGGDFTTFGNYEFEVLWGAKDRDDEVEFRLLFTPLAIKQLLELMKDKEVGFGDNFNFIKKKMINYVYPDHMYDINLDGDPTNFISYDFEVIRNNFINYNVDYFKTLFFGFAPILSIPLYQHQKPHEYIYHDSYESYLSFYAHEYAVNTINDKNFNNPLSNTPNILKTRLLKNEGKKDEIEVISYGYETIERVDYVPKLGGDGSIHSVPVHWTEYIEVEQHSTLELEVEDDEESEMTWGDKFKYAVNKLKTGDIAKEELSKYVILPISTLEKEVALTRRGTPENPKQKKKKR